MKRWILAIFLILSLVPPVQVAAQDSIRVLDEEVETSFREHITFNINLESDSSITEARLLYRVAGQIATARGDADIEPGTRVEASFVIDQERDYLPPGTELEYWWKITDEAGNELKTEPQSLLFMDDRHDWQELINERLTPGMEQAQNPRFSLQMPLWISRKSKDCVSYCLEQTGE